jgi:hypothetical protein
MHAYSEAPLSVAEGSTPTATMDATAITSSISDTLAQTANFSAKSPRTRQALFLQAEQRLVQTLYALFAQGLFPPNGLVPIRDDTPEPVKLWLALDRRQSEIVMTLPESIQQALFESMDERSRNYTIQFGPKDVPSPRPRPASAGSTEPEKQPLAFRPRPRPPTPPEAAQPAAGFNF